MIDDATLIRSTRDGDNEAFAELWRRHSRAGLVAARNLAPTLDADDLISEAYTRILDLLQRGKGPKDAFRPYLYRTIQTIAADRFRSSERVSEEIQDVADPETEKDFLVESFDLEATRNAFQRLPDNWRSVLWYVEVEGLKPREVAPLLGMSAARVSSNAHRAREGLRSAWVEQHASRATSRTCEIVLPKLQRYQRGRLTARASREVAAHLETCASCRAALREFSMLNEQLALGIAIVLLGGGAIAPLVKKLHESPVSPWGSVEAAAAAATIYTVSGTAAVSKTVPPVVWWVVGGLAATAAVTGVVLFGANNSADEQPSGGTATVTEEQPSSDSSSVIDEPETANESPSQTAEPELEATILPSPEPVEEAAPVATPEPTIEPLDQPLAELSPGQLEYSADRRGQVGLAGSGAVPGASVEIALSNAYGDSALLKTVANADGEWQVNSLSGLSPVGVSARIRQIDGDETSSWSRGFSTQTFGMTYSQLTDEDLQHFTRDGYRWQFGGWPGSTWVMQLGDGETESGVVDSSGTVFVEIPADLVAGTHYYSAGYGADGGGQFQSDGWLKLKVD